MSEAVYVYCIVRSASRPGGVRVPSGLPGAAPPAVEAFAERLWIVSARVPLAQYGPGALEPCLQDLEWVSRIALAHEAVVECFARLTGTAVIPMKLFTMFSTLERARSGLRRQASELRRVFERIEGCEEWGVRVSRGSSPAPVRRQARPQTGTAFLAARKQARYEAVSAVRAAAQVAERAFASLSKLAREQRRRPVVSEGGGALLLDAAFLVPLQRRARFHAAAERMASEVARRGGRMTLTGPWPPYNFVDAGDGV